MALAAFLRTGKQAWMATLSSVDATITKPVHMVIGNQACDADSCISAILLAYHRAHKCTSTTCIPVISCFSKDFVLRREAKYLLGLACEQPIHQDTLLFLDDLRFDVLKKYVDAGSLKITLVDHNKMDGYLSSIGGLEDSVCEIVDHHKDVHAHPHVSGVQRNVSFDETIGRGVGSTCTLIAEEFLAAERGGDHVLMPDIADLLTGVILLDTINLDPAAGKTTPQDVRVVSELSKYTSSGFEASSLFGRLSELKSDVSWWQTLSTEQIAGYDYKDFAMGSSRVGVTSIGYPLTVFFGVSEPTKAQTLRDKLGDTSTAVSKVGTLTMSTDRIAELQRFAISGGLQSFVLLSLYEGKRQLAIVNVDESTSSLYKYLCSALEAVETLQLSCVSPDDASVSQYRVYLQGNRLLSRKQIVPLLEEIMTRAP